MLVDMLLGLRQRLVEDIEQNNRDDLMLLLTTFGVLREISYSTHDNSLISVLVGLEDSAQSAAMGVLWKAPIPPVETIHALSAEKTARDRV